MIRDKVINEISERIKENSTKVRFGIVSVAIKIHEGNVVAVSHETTETIKQKEIIHNEND
jgi:hypothetical protein